MGRKILIQCPIRIGSEFDGKFGAASNADRFICAMIFKNYNNIFKVFTDEGGEQHRTA